MPARKKLASVTHSLIINLLSGAYQNLTKTYSQEILEQFRSDLVCSKAEEFENFISESSAVLWVRGYEITSTEKEEGRVGNFILIGIERQNDEYYINHEKIPSTIGKHPQKKRNFENKPSPDEGFETIRFAIKHKQFKSLQDAMLSLNTLCTTFPKTTIRVHPRKVSVLVYNSREKGIMRKSIKLMEADDHWYLDYKDNEHTKEEIEEIPSLLKIYISNFNNFSNLIIGD